MKGDRNDPEWAWYWEENDAEVPWTNAPCADPHNNWRHDAIETRIEARYIPPAPASDEHRKEFRRILRWLPSAYRIAVQVQYSAGGRGKRAPWAYGHAGLPQSTWSDRVRMGEEFITNLAPIYREAERRKPGWGSYREALKRVHWPDILSARVDTGGTLSASMEVDVSQSTVHKRCQIMAEDEPMVRAIMAWRRKTGRVFLSTKDIFPSMDCLYRPLLGEEAAASSTKGEEPVTYHHTDAQKTHDEIILEMLRGGWCHSADLVARTQTRNLQARIACLENNGWVIDRRPSTSSRDGKEYRAIRMDQNLRNRGPKQIHIRIPAGCPVEAIKYARQAALDVLEEAMDRASEERTMDLLELLDL